MTDHEKRIREALEARPVQYACHADGEVDKSCAFDPGQNLYDCVIATRLGAKGLRKTDCEEGKPINAPKSTVEVSAANLRALLADLDAMRGALELYLAHAPEPECAIWRHVQQKAFAALKGAEA